MTDRPFEIDDIKILTPHTFTPSASTTSTEDSGRVQLDLEMKNNPMGTIESYNIRFEDIPVKESAAIYQKIVNRNKYRLRFMSVGSGEYETDWFYTTMYSWGSLKQANGGDVWEFMSFNAIRNSAV